MQDHSFEGRIAIVPMSAPAARSQIHFHIALGGWRIANLDKRATEIRPSFQIMEARMKNPNWLTVQGFKLIAQQPLVLPDGLEQALGRRFRVFAQDRHQSGADAPLGVKAVLHGRDLVLLLRGLLGIVKPPPRSEMQLSA
jgi:hypothetical protein